jgi:hypothetical protein
LIDRLTLYGLPELEDAARLKEGSAFLWIGPARGFQGGRRLMGIQPWLCGLESR